MNRLAFSLSKVKPVECSFGINENYVSFHTFFKVLTVKADCHDLETSCYKDFLVSIFKFISLDGVESVSCFFLVDEIDFSRQALNLIDLCGFMRHVLCEYLFNAKVLNANLILVLKNEQRTTFVIHHKVDVARALKTDLVEVLGELFSTD